MYKIFISLSLLASLSLAAQYHSFNYTGPLNGNGWVNHSGTDNETVTLTTAAASGNSLDYPGILTPQGNRALITSSQSEDVNLAFSQPVSTTAYVSFLMKITDVGSLAANTTQTPPGYFMHFSPSSGSSLGSSGLVSRVSLRKGSTANTFNIGILNTTGGTASMTDIYGSANPTDFQVGTTYLVVLKYDMTGASGQTSLWINPAIASEGTPLHSSTFGTSNKLSQVSSVALRQANNIGTMEIDELRLGSSWAEVFSNATLLTAESKSTSKPLLSNTLVDESFTLLTKENCQLEIISTTGRIVKKGNFKPNQEVQISELSSGIYFVRIIENNKISVIKILKK